VKSPRRQQFALSVAVAIGTACASAQPARQPARLSSESKFVESLGGQIESLRAGLGNGNDLKGALAKAQTLMDLTIAYASPDKNADLYRRAAECVRMTNLLWAGKADSATAAFFAANPETASAVAFAIGPDDDASGVLGVLGALRTRYPDRVGDRGQAAGTSELVAAMCVVYDDPPPHPTLPPFGFAERGPGGKAPLTAPKIDPVAVYDYFWTHQSRLLFGGATPSGLLIHEVDVHSTISDLEWALGHYAGNRAVGVLFDSIVYDTANLKRGTEKKAIAAGEYNLPGIKRYGGVCAEQALFATEVGKAIGVPTAYTTAQGPDLGHAWVGYLKQTGNGANGAASWDFSEGRYDDYEDIQGHVVDPQTHRTIPDAFVSLRAGLVSATPAQRRQAVALTDAAERVRTLSRGKVEFPPPYPQDWGTPAGKARPANSEAANEMLKQAVRLCAADERAWLRAADMAGKGELTQHDQNEWARAAMDMCGHKFPDFALAVITPMVRSIKDAHEQDRMWEWAFSQFNARPDLAAAARFEQGRAWEIAGDPGKAWDDYQDVINRFANEGSIVVQALAQGEKLLKKTGRPEAALGMYENAFRRISKPKKVSPGASTVSNYYRVGSRYASLLDAAGKTADAKRVRDMIGMQDAAGR